MPAPEGYTSLGVIGYTDKGTYAAGTTYNKFNVVLYNGSSYVAIKDGLTGVTPTNDGVNWRLFANGFPDNGVTTDNFQATLENYLDQTESTTTNKAPSSAYLKTLADGINENISELTSSLNSGTINSHDIGTFNDNTTMEAAILNWIKTIPQGKFNFAIVTVTAIDMANGLRGGSYGFIGFRKDTYGIIFCLAYWDTNPIRLRIMQNNIFTTTSFYSPFEVIVPAHS